MRAARAEIDLDAIAHNVSVLVDRARPAQVCAVVKADGYGHGAIAVSHAALDAGATWLAVALLEEGAVLRKAGISAPVLLLSQPPLDDFGPAVRFGLELTVYTLEGIEAAADAAAAAGTVARLHLKVNTGMNRVGAHPDQIVDLARRIAKRPELELAALWTHCAVADEPGDPFTAEQLARFDAVIAQLDAEGLRPPMLHAANSAATIEWPASHHDLVRCGIALYGIDPAPAFAGRLDLLPALALKAEVAFVKRVHAGDAVSYGLRHRFAHDTTVVTVPIGYADGVRRSLSAEGGEVLIGGRRHPIVGTVTMDQLMVDVGDLDVVEGDEVVLIGRQGDAVVTATEWAERLGTIGYEIVCGIGPRVPRYYLRSTTTDH